MTKLEEKYIKVSKDLTKLAIAKAINVCIQEGEKGFVQLHAYKERLIDVIEKDRDSQINHHLTICKWADAGRKKGKDEWMDFDESELYRWEKEMFTKIEEEIKNLKKSFSNTNIMDIELNNYRVAE